MSCASGFPARRLVLLIFMVDGSRASQTTGDPLRNGGDRLRVETGCVVVRESTARAGLTARHARRTHPRTRNGPGVNL